ncbi:MAG: hypothetical protein QF842_06400 [Candidatus Marinimicrobia bacterium]|nr:hypothetical protein [Candidatus Neomarinimicrobiota bacterium]MDP6339938.1 hypothetical protein [Candidatus Neomarinimicrobiota bacterium]MDP6611425.1 hypothetical protein [Candidatus Neomarinimicrobiota bacterium]MDP7513065.1 hypothetical protein [Candidatus Neomarinimicrobiota bacterium]
MNKPLIYEPMTAFTDLLIFGLGLYFARELYGIYATKLMSVHLHFMLVFFFMSLAGLLGAMTHGIGPHLPQSIHTFIWRITLYCIGLTTFSMLLGGLYHVVPFNTMDWLKWLPLLGLIVYMILITRNDDFKTVIRFYTPAMMLLLLMMLYSLLRFQSDGTSWIIFSVLMAFAGTAVQQSGFSFHKHFNHNDIYHVFQMGSMFLLYKGVILLK